jgi:ABC-type multidrug transport system ATPase subunit/pSer/pThr/pTyr-binding forkhead associated (FHA) protein
VTIGRAEENEVVVSGEKVSRRHARVEQREDGAYVSDLGSRHGTAVNGEPLGEEPRLLESGDAIEVGGELVRFLAGEGTRMASRVTPATEIRSVRFEGERLTIGRDAANDLVLSDPNVSRFHAEVIVSGDGAEVVDLGSRNGTRVDGRLVERAPLERGASIGIGPYRLVSSDDGIVATSEAGALRMEARAISVRVGEKTILQPASLSLEPGELVAIIGESGAGKSTMLKVLAGVDQASDGAVTVNGEPLAARLTDVAYVPQDDIVHPLLGVREALGYAARLRLPQDAEPREVDEAIDAVLEELALEEHAGTRVGRLSGGQRRRTSVAAELLGKPGLVFLDEPTTGMDPGLETKMMELFRELADGSRGVALVTHATKNLALCDRVVVMGRGGRLVFDGPPKDAATFFGVEGYDGIYTALDEAPAERWPAQAADDEHAQEAATGDEAELGRGSTMTQISVLVSRYLKLLVRDRKNMALLIGQAPILALAGVGLFNAGILDRPGGSPFLSIQFLFLAGLTVLWLGAIDAAQEVVKERAVLERERAVGVKLRAYLASKLVVLFGLVTVQTLLYAGLLLALRPLDADFGAWAAVFALLVATGCVAVCLGLAISSISGTPDQAMSFVPLAVIPQLLFAGAIVPVQGMAEPAQTISYGIFAQWWLAASGTAVDMNARIAESRDPAGAASFGTGFFDVGVLPGMAVLLAFAIAFLGAFWLALRERRA